MKGLSNPKISVIMSVYNGLPYLKAAVRSILNQTHKNFEFIIVDDASNDGTWDYLKSFRDKRVKLVKNPKNLGLAKSLNIALRQAQGEYIARMDADDVSLPRRFERQIKFLTKNPDIDICGTWVNLIDEAGKIIGEKKYPKRDSEIKKQLVWQLAIIHPTFMAKASFFKQLSGYNPEFDLAEEYELLMRASNNFKMANIGQKLLLWRLHQNRRSRQEMRKMDLVDLKIKLEYLKREGFTFSGMLAVFKRFILIYTLPYALKIRLAKLLKIA